MEVAEIPWRAIAALLFMAAVVRVYVLANTALISIDGVEYVRVARLYGSFKFSEALGQSYPPVYPLLIALFHAPGIPWETAKAQLAFIPYGHKKKRHNGPWEFMRLLRESAPIQDLRAWIRDEYPALFKRERGDEEERVLAEEGAE